MSSQSSTPRRVTWGDDAECSPTSLCDELCIDEVDERLAKYARSKCKGSMSTRQDLTISDRDREAFLLMRSMMGLGMA